jgi:methylated-DNA-protein-cysteine methyltransferase-like protein
MGHPLHRQWYDARDGAKLHTIGYYFAGTRKRAVFAVKRGFTEDVAKQKSIVIIWMLNAASPWPRRSVEMSWEPVYRLVKRIPRGQVTTYGTLARMLRFRGGARAVGYAMAACPSGRGIPWHRVVGAGGRLIIREPHAGLQRRLLESEGMVFEGRRVDMRRYGWAPAKRKSAGRKRAKAR